MESETGLKNADDPAVTHSCSQQHRSEKESERERERSSENREERREERERERESSQAQIDRQTDHGEKQFNASASATSQPRVALQRSLCHYVSYSVPPL